jgi:hypothetical protein
MFELKCSLSQRPLEDDDDDPSFVLEKRKHVLNLYFSF